MVGRRPKPAGQKRELVAVRFEGPVYRALKEDAALADETLAHEVERRASILAGLRPDTLNLIELIVGRIRNLEQATRKKWFEDVETWAAVRAMLADGPIVTVKPLLSSEEEEMREAIAPVTKLRAAQLELRDRIAAYGVTVLEFADPTPSRGLGVGMAPRRTEKAAIGAIEDEQARAGALADHAELELLDRKRMDALVEAQSVMMAHSAEVDRGKAVWREISLGEAEQKRRRGEKMRIDELVEVFATWR